MPDTKRFQTLCNLETYSCRAAFARDGVKELFLTGSVSISDRMMLMKRQIPLAVCVLCFFPFVFLANIKSVFAHHGKDFLIVETSEIPEKGESFFISSFEGGASKKEWTPGFLYSWTDFLATEVHAHFENGEEQSLKFSSFAPEIRINLNALSPSYLSDIAFSAEYEFAKNKPSEFPADEAAPDEDHLKKFHEGESSDAKESHKDRFEIRLIFSKFLNSANVAFNLVFNKQKQEAGEYGYAFGVKKNIGRKLDFGFEADGSFKNSLQSRMMPAVYFSEKQGFNVNVGVVFSSSKNKSTTLLSSLVLKF